VVELELMVELGAVVVQWCLERNMSKLTLNLRKISLRNSRRRIHLLVVLNRKDILILNKRYFCRIFDRSIVMIFIMEWRLLS